MTDKNQKCDLNTLKEECYKHWVGNEFASKIYQFSKKAIMLRSTVMRRGDINLLGMYYDSVSDSINHFVRWSGCNSRSKGYLHLFLLEKIFFTDYSVEEIISEEGE